MSATISKYVGLVFTLFHLLLNWECVSASVPFPAWPNQQILKQFTADAAVYPGLKKTGLKLTFSDTGSFDDLVESTQKAGFLKIGLFCVERGAFILYRKPNFNIDNADDFKIASGENRCFIPTGIESAQPIGPLAVPKRDSITFFTKRNFASIAHPTSGSVTRSFFSSIKSSVKSLIIIGTKKWTLLTAKGDVYCIRPVNYDAKEKHPICMLPDLSATNVKNAGINIVRVVIGCADSINKTINVNFCNYWGAVPEVVGEGTKTMIEDETSLAGRSDGEVCTGGGDADRLLKDTLYYFKALLTDHFDQHVLLHFGRVSTHKWKLEMIDLVWDIAKRATPSSIVPTSYMNRIRELFVAQVTNAYKRHQADNKTNEKIGASDEILVGSLTEYDYRALIYQTKKCLDLLDDDQARSNWAAWHSITDPHATEKQIWEGLVRRKEYNIVVEMAYVILNMVGGLCHKIFGYTHNYWAWYIHFAVKMYLEPVADKEWINPAELGDINIILGGDMDIQYNKLAIFASLALFAANGLEPFQRPSPEKTSTVSP